MGELEDRINSVLSDPGQLAQIRAMAQSLMGGSAPESVPGGKAPLSSEASGAEAAMLGKLGALLRGGAGGKNPRFEALEALAPCLGEKRREKLGRAMKLARVLRLAQAGLFSAEGQDV